MSVALTVPPKQVEVVLDSRVDENAPINVEELSLAAKSMGMANVNAAYLKGLSGLGISLKGHAIIQMATGGAFVSQQALLHALHELERMMGEADEELKPEFTAKIGYIADKLSRVSSAMIKMSDSIRNSEENKEKPKRRSFDPCTVIQNNYYGSGADQKRTQT